MGVLRVHRQMPMGRHGAVGDGTLGKAMQRGTAGAGATGLAKGEKVELQKLFRIVELGAEVGGGFIELDRRRG